MTPRCLLCGIPVSLSIYITGKDMQILLPFQGDELMEQWRVNAFPNNELGDALGNMIPEETSHLFSRLLAAAVVDLLRGSINA
jgi:hypothetical protein